MGVVHAKGSLEVALPPTSSVGVGGAGDAAGWWWCCRWWGVMVGGTELSLDCG